MRAIVITLLFLACPAPGLLRAEEAPTPAVPLHLAALRGDLRAVQEHVEAGSDLNAKDAYGSTPLIIATTFGHKDVAQALIGSGADLAIPDKHGSQALHIAAFLGREGIVETLLGGGADRFARNGDGSTAYDIVAQPFADDRATYDGLVAALAPLGLTLDYAEVEAARPRVAQMLRPSAEAIASVTYAPLDAGGWTRTTPAEVGLEPTLLAELFLDASNLNNLYGLLVVKDGRLVAEGYFHEGSVSQLSSRQSVTKSFLSALFGIARREGCLPDLDRAMIASFPELAEAIEDPRKNEITVRQLLQMRGGYPQELLFPKHHHTLYFTDNWNWIPHLVDFPLVRDPGTGFGYSNVTSHALAVLLARACETDLASYAEQHLFAPIGAKLASWGADPAGYRWGWGELQVTARDMARFGLLYLNDGACREKEVLPADWVAASLRSYTKDAWTTPKIGRYFSNVGYGYQWWSATVGEHTFDFAWGHGGQLIVLLDEYDMVIVTTADPLTGKDPLRDPGWDEEQAIINVVGKFIASLALRR